MIKQKMLEVLSFTDEKYLEEADPTQYKSRIAINWKKITAIAAGVCVFIAALLIGLFVPSNNSPTVEKPLEWGFKYENGCEMPSKVCAYRSDTNTFDIDNVTLTFYFGGIFGPDVNFYREHAMNVPEFDIFFGDSNFEPIQLIRHSNDNFVSEEYNVTLLIDENYNTTEIKYNHSEIVTIPKELFTKQQGIINIGIGGIDILEREPKYDRITSVTISYDIIGEKVVLSPWDGYRK